MSSEDRTADREPQGGGAVAGQRLDFLVYSDRFRIDRYLAGGKSMSLLLFEIEHFEIFNDLYGGLIAGRVIEIMEAEIHALCKEHLGECELLFIQNLEPGRFIVFFGKKELESVSAISEIVLAFRLKLRSRIRQEALNLTGRNLHILAGHSLLEHNGRESIESILYKALVDAQKVARGALDAAKLSLLQEFRDIIAGRNISMVYQPIVNLETGDILAWEALTRGPKDSHFLAPAVLFDFAEEVGQIFILEKTARETAIERLGTLDSDQKLFLNVHPRTLMDPDFSPGETVKYLEANGFKPSDVVLEITERHSVQDFTLFHRTLQHYRDQGFKVAVDDVGTGYSGLWSIAEIRPDFLKVDMSLVRGIDGNPVKRALLETFVTFSENIGCRLVAEGIEDEGELAALMRMGVHLGQGYFLSRPQFPKPGLEPQVRKYFSANARMSIGDRRFSKPVRALLEEVPKVAPDVTVGEVKKMLEEGGPISSVVVEEGGRPKGLVMSHHLDRALSSQYGVAVYYNRPISLIMDPQPLYAEAGTPVENVAREAMTRKKNKVFDHIVITEQGKLAGIVSVQNMLDNMAKHQVEMAKGANPLTGLPGNVVIELELERRSRSKKPFSVVYADLDNFKVYNDTYGFKNGDNILLLLTRILSFAIRRHGHPDEDFVGHIGGDDFMMITAPERAERVCKSVTRCFSRLVKNCYMPQDRQRGWVEARSRTGELRKYPLVSVSLAMVECLGVCEPSELGRRAAEMKKFAKSIPGNSYVKDRRSPLGGAQRANPLSFTDNPDD